MNRERLRAKWLRNTLARRRRMIALGLCGCGKPRRPELMTCEHCGRKRERSPEYRAKEAERMRRKRQAERRNCVCGEPLPPRKHSCPACKSRKAECHKSNRRRKLDGERYAERILTELSADL